MSAPLLPIIGGIKAGYRDTVKLSDGKLYPLQDLINAIITATPVYQATLPIQNSTFGYIGPAGYGRGPQAAAPLNGTVTSSNTTTLDLAALGFDPALYKVQARYVYDVFVTGGTATSNTFEVGLGDDTSSFVAGSGKVVTVNGIGIANAVKTASDWFDVGSNANVYPNIYAPAATNNANFQITNWTLFFRVVAK